MNKWYTEKNLHSISKHEIGAKRTYRETPEDYATQPADGGAAQGHSTFVDGLCF